MTEPGVVFILKGYPRLSETFIAQEIRALELRGIPIRIVSLRHPTDKYLHPVHREIAAKVDYLPEYLYQEPIRVLKGWWRARKLPGYSKAFRQWIADFKRDLTPNRGRRFGQACILATELAERGDPVRRLHAHFLHTPASVAYYTHLMTGIPWSCSAHAKDIWITPAWEKREKLASMDWLVTCTESGHRHLSELAPNADKVALVYHGLDFARFPEPNEPQGPTKAAPLSLLSVGRLVPKKGFAGLIEALGRLPKDLDWRFRHIGGGPLKAKVLAQAKKLGIAERIQWLGAQPQEKVLEEYRAADLFVLNCRIAEDGDRDGLPNVLMEAQSQRLAVVSTTIAGIPELVVSGETGLLVPPEDSERLATAIESLLRDSALRRRYADAGFARVHERFAAARGIADLERRFKADLL